MLWIKPRDLQHATQGLTTELPVLPFIITPIEISAPNRLPRRTSPFCCCFEICVCEGAMVLGMQPRALRMSAKRSTPELHAQSHSTTINDQYGFMNVRVLRTVLWEQEKRELESRAPSKEKICDAGCCRLD